MGRLLLLHSKFKPAAVAVSIEQLALAQLLRLLKSTFQYRARVLMTSTDSSLFGYFQSKRPAYRILKGGRTALVPIYTENNLWAVLQIQSFKIMNKGHLEKIKNAINDILIPSIETHAFLKKPNICDGMNVFLNCSVPEDRVKVALEILDQTSKSSMIYWEALRPAPKKVSELYELQDTLILIKEVLALNPEQRKLIALYMNLPANLRGAQLVVSSAYAYPELKKFLHGESLFLDTLDRFRFDVKEAFKLEMKHSLIKELSLSLKEATSYSHLI